MFTAGQKYLQRHMKVELNKSSLPPAGAEHPAVSYCKMIDAECVCERDKEQNNTDVFNL